LIITFITSLFLGNSDINRSIGTLGEPNALAAFVVFLWPFLFFTPGIAHKYRRYIQVGCLILSLLIIFLSGSRSGLTAFIVQAIFYLSLKINKNLRLSLVIGLLLIEMAYLLPISENTQYENRSVIWHTALVAGFINPIAGGGFGNTELLLSSVIRKEHNSLIGSYIDSSHNIFLDWWVQGGLVGVGILAALFIFVIKNFYVEKRTFELILFLGLLVVFSLNPVSVISLIQLWWLIGQSFRKSFRP
jgi:O-antigen ligase